MAARFFVSENAHLQPRRQCLAQRAAVRQRLGRQVRRAGGHGAEHRHVRRVLRGERGGGEGRAARIYREAGGQSFWTNSAYNQFPGETKDYVPMVIAAAWLFLHPKDFCGTLVELEEA